MPPIPHAPSSGDNYINSNDDADEGILNEFKTPEKAIFTVSETEPWFFFWKHSLRNKVLVLPRRESTLDSRLECRLKPTMLKLKKILIF